MLSASHNPAADNGIKFFGRGRRQAARRDGRRDRGEVARRRPAQRAGRSRGPPLGFGRVTDAYSAHETYLDHLLATLPAVVTGSLRCTGCASSWTARTAPPTASARARCAGPGPRSSRSAPRPTARTSTRASGRRHLDTLAAAVIEHGADAGLAFDGDADRCLAVDGDGQPLDGDQILAVLASQLKRGDQLAGDAVVVTVMSNLGFHDAMRESGISGDRDPGRRQARLRRDAGRRLHPRRRAVRAHHPDGPRHHRGRRADRPAPARRGEQHRHPGLRRREDDDQVPAGADQRPR